MSVNAMCWVFSQDIRPSTAKFVLLALADCASYRGDGRSDVYLAYPSIETICESTSQDRKTVIGGLQRLEELGLLKDTGKRVGATMQTKVYQLVGLPSEYVHYVYKLTNKETGEFYIGVRSCSAQPEEDQYWGSGKWSSLQKTPATTLKKEILKVFESRPAAEAYEIECIWSETNNPLCQNKASRKRYSLKSPESGIVPHTEQFRISHERVPFFPAKSPENGTGNHYGTIKEQRNPPIIPPPGGNGEPPKRKRGKTELLPTDDFLTFWDAYPRREAMKRAFEAWNKAHPKLEVVLEALRKAKKDPSWNRGKQYIPLPATWINGERWDDEL